MQLPTPSLGACVGGGALLLLYWVDGAVMRQAGVCRVEMRCEGVIDAPRIEAPGGGLVQGVVGCLVSHVYVGKVTRRASGMLLLVYRFVLYPW